MKRKFNIALIFVVSTTIVKAQDSTSRGDYKRLLSELEKSKEDTNRVNILSQLAWVSGVSNKDTSLKFYNQAIALAHKIKAYEKEAYLRNRQGNEFWNVANYPAALENYMQALRYFERTKKIEGEKIIYSNFGNIYYTLGNYRKAISYTNMGLLRSDLRRGFEYGTIAKAYLGLGMRDSALFFCQKAIDIARETDDKFNSARSLHTLGEIYLSEKKIEKSLASYKEGLEYAMKIEWLLGIAELKSSVAKIYSIKGVKDSAVYYANEALAVARKGHALGSIVDASLILHDIYKAIDLNQSLVYLEQAYAAKDSLFSNQKINALQNFAQSEEARQNEKEAVELEYRNSLIFYGLVAGLLIIALIAFIQLRSNKQRKKANLLLTQQKQQLETALQELKSTQKQLIQAEKMASLGELTGGIAHEIQNPLNFVNNFSEVNKELTDELEQEIDKGNYSEAKAIAKDIRDNEEKINYHGKRADAIVKSMLQHSRQSTGKEEPTDIDVLCDEYLRLAYHGLRAKDKSFNAKIETDFDNSIGKINTVPQDIGRVVLNLINNAFYAVNEKAKQNIPGYEPTVIVSTKKENARPDDPVRRGKVTISIKDNGTGIPESIKEKIFQPFFTTKPTGQGTGLGLSLSYDIIKAHGGTLQAESKESTGTEMIVSLPS